ERPELAFTCTERSGFSRRGRHARRSACGSSPSSYPASSPPTRHFLPGCLYRATDAQQVAGEEILEFAEQMTVSWLTSIAGRRAVHRAMALDDRCARVLPAGSFHL